MCKYTQKKKQLIFIRKINEQILVINDWEKNGEGNIAGKEHDFSLLIFQLSKKQENALKTKAHGKW